MLIRLRHRFLWLHAAAALATAVAPAAAQPSGELGCDDPAHHAGSDASEDQGTEQHRPDVAAHDHGTSPFATAIDSGPTVQEHAVEGHGHGSTAASSPAGDDCDHCPTSDCETDPGCEVPTTPAEITTRSQVRQDPCETGPSPEYVHPHPAPAPPLWSPPPRVTL